MDKQLLIDYAKQYGLIPKNYVAPSLHYAGKIDSSRAAGPLEVYAIYTSAANEGAPFSDLNESALYYYGLPYGALMAACGVWLAFH